MSNFCDIEELYSVFKEANGVSIDTRTIQNGELFFGLKGPNFDGNQYASKALELGAAFVVIDDTTLMVPQDHRYLLVNDTLEALQNLAHHHRMKSDCKIFALTGSNGKTTTKELIVKVLERKYRIIHTRGNLNNHIGVPLTLLTIKPSTEIAVIEMGANHVGEIAKLCEIAKPEIGMITNIGEAHLEGFGGIEGIKKGKGELYESLKASSGHILVNTSERFLDEMAGNYSKKWLYDDKVILDWKIEFVEGDRQILQLSNGEESLHYPLSIYGSYNQPNILAAINLGLFLDVDLKDCLEAVAAYIPSNKRSEVLDTEKNRIILDAYNANPSSMRVAIASFAQKEGDQKVMILGDMFELGDESENLHQEIVDLADSTNATIYYIGEHFAKCKTKSAQFHSTVHFSQFLENHEISDSLILIKGSRGMALEKVVPFL